MDKYKKLANDSIIFSIGTIGSKIISLLMVSFYSYMLSKKEYGQIDVTQTSVSLIIPFLTLCIHEAVLRFCLKDKDNKEKYFTNGLLLIATLNLLVVPICFLLQALSVLNGNIWIVMLVIVGESFYNLLAQFAKGIDKNKVFVLAGIVMTFSMCAFNILFLKVVPLGINGYFVSQALAYFTGILVLALCLKIRKFFAPRKMSKKILGVMLLYSVPLIPNSLMWFLMNAADKYVILYMLGDEANGIYAVAGKIPTILTTITTIFTSAWLISAINESDSEEKNVFYSNVFSLVSTLLFLMVCALLFASKTLMRVAINSEYTDVWKYVPFLLIASIFSTFSVFLGTNYSASGKTNGAFFTTVVGGILNVGLNFLFIYLIGLNGAALGTSISFLVVWIIRLFDTRKFVSIKYHWVRMVLSMLLLAVQVCLYFMCNEMVTILSGVAVFLALAFVNRKDVFNLIKYVLKKDTPK